MDTGDAAFAKLAIRDALARYCRAWDRMDVALAIALWHPDGTARYPGEAEVLARPWLAQRLNARRQIGMKSSHQITNSIVELAGDRAASEAYGTAWSQEDLADGNIRERHYCVRYLDRWSLRDGSWAMDRRTVLVDFGRTLVFPRDRDDPAPVTHANPNAEDPSYSHFASLKS